MADKGTKTLAGTPGKTTVIGFTPVTYQISIQYLGWSYVARNDEKYRCRFELKQEGGGSLESLPQAIPNIVKGDVLEQLDPAAISAATPQPEGGPMNPVLDTVYRLVVRDNHTLPDVDINLLGNEGSPNGDKVSRPDYYKKSNRKWMKDVQPLVPMRIIVRRFQGAAGALEQVDLDAKPKVVIEVKDPAEEFVHHAESDGNAVRNFQWDFFKKYNRTDSEPTEGDDNCLEHFQGIRKPSDSKPGVIASKVIRKIPYVPSPTPDSTLPWSVEFSEVAAKGAYKSHLVKFDPEIVDVVENGRPVKIGVVDFVFSPWPVLGDNHRFLTWLVDGSGTDIRKTKVAGSAVSLVDDQKKPIPAPRAYCTGRFVIWRRLDVRILITANTLPASDIGWDVVREYYRHVFIEIGDPQETRELPLMGWRQSIIDVFNGGAATGEFGRMSNYRPDGTSPGDPAYNSIYAQGLIPPFMNPAARNAWDAINLCKDIMRKVVRALPALSGGDTPESRNVDGEGEGLYMIYGWVNTPGGVLGCWLGDGMVLVGHGTGSDAGNMNKSATHELAHGMFLRHSNTSLTRAYDSSTGQEVIAYIGYWKEGDGSPTTTYLVDPTRNCYPEDHDQHYSFKCTMTYQEIQQFCGVCALSLRFYDRVKVQDKSRFQKRIMEGYFLDNQKPENTGHIVVVSARPEQPDQILLFESPPPLGKGDTFDLVAVGPEREFHHPKNGTVKGRTFISRSDKNSLSMWKSSNPGVVSLSDAGVMVAAKAKAKGTATITFSRYGMSLTLKITVT